MKLTFYFVRTLYNITSIKGLDSGVACTDTHGWTVQEHWQDLHLNEHLSTIDLYTRSNFYNNNNRVNNDWNSLPKSIADSPSLKHCWTDITFI